MKHPYTEQSRAPAALFLPATLHVRGSRYLTATLNGKLDTAADMTAIPRPLALRRGMLKFGSRRIRQTGRDEDTYLVDLELDGVIYAVEAVVLDISYVLIGRDILNQLKLIADGPNETFELIHPKT